MYKLRGQHKFYAEKNQYFNFYGKRISLFVSENFDTKFVCTFLFQQYHTKKSANLEFLSYSRFKIHFSQD